MVWVPAWAPARVTMMFFTPEPPALSAAVKASVTSCLLQPAALAAGDWATVVVGATRSPEMTNSRLLETMSNCCRPTEPASPMLRSDLLLNSISQFVMIAPAS